MSQTEITGILQEMRAEVQKMATSGVNPTQDIKDELQAIISGLKDIKASGFTTGGATSGDSSIKNELMDITAQMKSEIQKLQVELKNKPSPVVQNDVVCRKWALLGSRYF
jgi:ribonuclease HI